MCWERASENHSLPCTSPSPPQPLQPAQGPFTSTRFPEIPPLQLCRRNSPVHLQPQLSLASRLNQAAEPESPPRLCLPGRGIPGSEAEQSWGDPRRQESIQGKERMKERYSAAKGVLWRRASPSRGTLPKGVPIQVLPSPKEAWFSPGAAACLPGIRSSHPLWVTLANSREGGSRPSLDWLTRPAVSSTPGPNWAAPESLI